RSGRFPAPRSAAACSQSPAASAPAPARRWRRRRPVSPSGSGSGLAPVRQDRREPWRFRFTRTLAGWSNLQGKGDQTMAGRLEGKVAVITGAASGIGGGTVALFVREGARVIAADIQDDRGARIEEDHKGKARYVRCDVMKEDDIAAAVAAAVKHFGKL